MTKRFRFLVGGTFILLSLSWSCSKGTEPEASDEDREALALQPADRITLSDEALARLDLEYEKAEERALVPSLEVPAELTPDPDRRATIGPRVAGRVVRVHVVVSDRVRQGDPLVVLESEAVGRARAELIAAKARLDVARRAAVRARGLLEDRVTSQRAVEEAEGALHIAEADLRAVEIRLSTFGASADETPLDPARIVLRSPIAGTVVARTAFTGQWVEPSDTLVEVADLAELWLLAAVYERELRYVEPGQPVQVEVRAYPGEVFSGTITQVADTLETETRSIPIRVVLPNPDRRLKPGMFATASIQGTHAHDERQLLAIPWSAVQEIDGHRAVFVRLTDGAFLLRRVHTGERAGDYVEILNGLAAGDEVVTEGSFLLKGELLKATLGEEE